MVVRWWLWWWLIGSIVVWRWHHQSPTRGVKKKTGRKEIEESVNRMREIHRTEDIGRYSFGERFVWCKCIEAFLNRSEYQTKPDNNEKEQNATKRKGKTRAKYKSLRAVETKAKFLREMVGCVVGGVKQETSYWSDGGVSFFACWQKPRKIWGNMEMIRK